MQSVHPDYQERLSPGVTSTQLKIERYFSTSKSSHVYGWLDLIVNGIMRCSIFFTDRRAKSYKDYLL